MALLMIKVADPRIRSSQVRMEETNAKDYHDMEILWKIFFKTIETNSHFLMLPVLVLNSEKLRRWRTKPFFIIRCLKQTSSVLKLQIDESRICISYCYFFISH